MSEPIETDKDGNALTLIDIIPDESDINEELELKLRLERLREIFPTALSDRERHIIELRYGLNGHKELTQREIAKKYNISRSYVSRIEKAALLKLKHYFK